MSSPYDSFAAAYDEWKEPDRYDLLCNLLTDFIVSQMPSANTGIDFGCGTGRLTALLAHKGFAMIGIDESLAMLTRARSRASTTVRYEHASFIDWQSPIEADFAIATSDTFDHVIDDNELIRSFLSVLASLRPDGLLIYDANGSGLRSRTTIEASTSNYDFTGKVVPTKSGGLSHRITITQSDGANTTILVNEKVRKPTEHTKLLKFAGFDRIQHLSIAPTPSGLTLAPPPREHRGKFIVVARRPALNALALNAR